MRHYIKRTRELGIRRAWKKFQQKLRQAAKRQELLWRWKFFHSTATPAWRLRLALRPGARNGSLQGLALHFPFWDPEQTLPLAGRLKLEFPGHVEAVLKKAEKIRTSPKTGLFWHKDPFSGHQWDPGTVYLGGSFEIPGTEPRSTWELSRFHHLVTLAQAYVLTLEKKYAEEITDQLEDWMRHNPPGLGINWSNAMEAGIRLWNVLFALGLVQNASLSSLEGPGARLRRLLPSFVFDHTLFILRNLEWPNNHLLADLAGLTASSCLYPNFFASPSWGDAARKEMIRQMEIQVYPDGMDFESSTHYHCLALELFFLSRLLWNKTGTEIPEAFNSRLEKMFTAVKAFQKPGGEIVQFGDNDSSRLMHLAPERPLLDRRYLFSWRDKDGSGLCPEQLWLFGPETGPEKNGNNKTEAKMFCLPQGGIYSFTQPQEDHFLCIHLAPNGQHGQGGHAHNDKLTFELVCFGEDIFIDPGTGCYLRDPSLRERLRSTHSHNTMSIEGEEQNRLNRGPFAISLDARCPEALECVWDKTAGAFRFTGRHDGYLRLDPPLWHQRTLEMRVQGSFELAVTDSIFSPKEIKRPIAMCWNFILAPAIEIEGIAGGTARLRTPLGRRYTMEASMPIEKGESVYSPEFGAVLPTMRLTARTTVNQAKSFTFRLKTAP